jgi:exopolysaccharide/PEP-CTERM locus tyrosine autokinase
MSKIEDALEKANILRENARDEQKQIASVFEKVEPVKVENPYIVTINDPDSPIAEEYRRLKSMLIRETKSDFLNTIMITSSVDSEGKSLTSINLAISMAQEIDHSMLLIDTDLRKPMIGNYLGIKYKYGLSDYLSRDIDLSEVLIRTGIGNLVLLPAGRPVANPVELLSSGKMKNLIKELKQRFMDRYIIVDTPPILAFAEGIALASCVDGIVFVVMEGRANKKSVENALNLIKSSKVLGIVFNNASMTNLDGQSYRYSSYRYSEKEGK